MNKNLLKSLLADVGRINQTLRSEFNGVFQKAGLDLLIDQWVILDYLKHNESVNATELSITTQKLPPSITRTIENFRKKRFISQSTDKTDKRKTSIKLTRKGALLVESANSAIVHHQSNVRNSDLKLYIDKLISTLVIARQSLDSSSVHFDEIILVDDDSIINLINRKIIEKNQLAESVRIINFSNPIDAIDYLRGKKDNSSSKTLILLDLYMPELDGWDVLEELQKSSAIDQLSVFILSSSVDSIEIKKALETPNIINFISKPLNEESFSDILESATLLN